MFLFYVRTIDEDKVMSKCFADLIYIMKIQMTIINMDLKWRLWHNVFGQQFVDQGSGDRSFATRFETRFSLFSYFHRSSARL